MLKMTDVSKVYPGGSVALQNVDIHIEPGEFVFVVGPSGAGKSTFIKMLFREVLPTTGSIFVNGVDILSLTPNEIPYMRRQLGIIFQDYRLLPERTVYENVAFALEVIGAKKDEIREKVLKALEEVGLKNKVHNYPDQLSGGEQQRVAIARAIVNNPKLLLCDEPTGNLDPEKSMEIMKVLDNINKTRGTTIIMATHDKDIVNTMKKQVLILKEGRLVAFKEKGGYDDEAVQNDRA